MDSATQRLPPEPFPVVKHRAVYTIVPCAGGKAYWLRIGNATEHADGTLTVHLDAMPNNGTLHIRDMPERPGT